MVATPTRPATPADNTPLDRAYLRAPRVPSFAPARIEWLDGTVETFPSFWDAWNSVEDRFAIADGNYILVEGDVVGRIVDANTVGE